MQLFHEPDILENGGFLNPTESNHCVRVLRHQEGDKIYILDGKGTLYEGVIEVASSKKCQIKIISTQKKEEKRPKLHIAVAPTKSIDRIEWFLEKAAEIGVNEITPIICKNSERKIVKNERLDKILISAIKQSKDYWKPLLNEQLDFEKFIKQDFTGQKYIAHCISNEESHLFDALKKDENVMILIGPEGDFTQNEVDLALNNGFIPISLGEKRLRTETAALYATTILNLKNK